MSITIVCELHGRKDLPRAARRAGPSRVIPILALLLAWAVPESVRSQTGVVVQGRVFDADTNAGIQNAIVDLVGHGATLSSGEGSFRFTAVPPGGYTLQVIGFGYARESRFLLLGGDTTISVALGLVPLPLDSLVVEAQLIDVEGRVRDPTRDLNVVDAEVLSTQTEPAWTGAHGRFELKDVVADVPLYVLVNAFGYLPLDTVVLPQERDDYLFEVEPDTVVERMVELQVQRLEERASPRRSVLMRAMNREQLLRYAGRLTIAGMLDWEYGRRLGRVQCVLINEEQLFGAWEPSTLYHILPEDVERVEFLFDGAMLRIYTREFMRQMISRDVPLRTPIYVKPFTSRPVDPICR